MQIKSINNLKNISFLEEKSPNKKSKNNEILLANVGISLIGLVGLACYNKFRINKKSNNIKDLSKDFLNLCKSFKVNNYELSEKNLKNGIFIADLHSHSNHSDGYANVKNILNEVANYSEYLYKKTGKNFTFALTDHDRVSGVIEAQEIIKNNPEKFKHVNFIPAVELSFSFNSNGNIKTGELLAYFINPKSNAIKMLVENLNINRYLMINNCIKKLGNGFNRAEMNNYFLNKDGETFAYNLHYRLFNYAQIKNRINKIAKETNQDATNLYKTLMQGYVFGDKRVPKPFVTPQGFDNYLKSINFKTNIPILDNKITELCKEYFPKIKNGQVVSNTENSFEKIIDVFKNEEDVVLAFAHPYFTAVQMTNYKKEFNYLLEYANGKIKMSENYHQAYHNNLPRNKIDEINQFLLEKNLIPIGGRDNHSSNFIPKNIQL